MSGDDQTKETGGAAIAIVGMAGRFPGAPNVRAFWKNLREGRESVTRFAPGELDDSFSDDIRAREEFVAARPVLDDVDLFDAEFFGMHAREAAVTDPQQRLLLECCWQALEDAGHDPATYNGAIGVFAGATVNTYFLKHIMRDRAAIEDYTSSLQVGSYQEFMGAMQDLIATRVAYKLDLKGPAINVQTACSTSLTAVAQACQSLLLYQSDMALAGGASITFPQRRGYLALEGGMVSTDGRCRPFDANASGTLFGHGVGVVVLKRLDDALADGDHIYAVIRGFGLNNDGASKIGLTAPSVEGQSAVIASALAMAGVEGADIGYVEAHGTATPLGDPIEFRGLEKAFNASSRGTCVLGSAKANVGHLDAAAGVTGLIKAALVLDREEIPPLVNFTAPNPNIDLAQSPFRILTDLTPWPAGGRPRLAGVSSFGVGGTNVHVVLEEAPRAATRALAAATWPHLLPLSARSAESLERMATALADRLEQDPTLELRDVAHTLQTGRRAFDVRMGVAACDRDQAIAALRTGEAARAKPKAAAPKVVFMFPGQGAQYPGMGKALYDAEPEFRRHVDRGAEVLEPLIGLDLRTLMFADAPADDDAPHPIRSTVMAQPALFVTEYALAKLLMSRGVEPAAMIGHSVGEFVAACIAGVLSFEDALKLVAARGRLMQCQPPGVMLSVRASEERLRELMTDGVDLAAINAPALTVAAGPFAAIEKLEARLDAEGVAHRRLHTSHAFHSAMMDPVVEGLKAIAAETKFSAPKLRYVSSVSGAWVGAEEASSPDYWARHCRQTVRFADALATLLAEPDLVPVEVGPGRTLSTFASQAKVKTHVRAALPTLPEFASRGEDRLTFAQALAGLWREGVALDWTKNAEPGGRRVSLPAYAFARKRHWIDAPVVVREGALAEHAQPIAEVAAPAFAPEPTPQLPAELTMTDRTTELHARIRKLLEELSGESLEGASNDASFLELGFDSLFLGQVAQRLQKTFGVKVTFRQLMREYPSIEALGAHLLATAKPEALPQAAPARPAAPAPAVAARGAVTPQPVAMPPAPLAAGGGIEALLQNQLVAMQQLFAQQLQTLQAMSGGAALPAQAAPLAAAAPAPKSTPVVEETAAPSRFQMYRPGQKTTIDEITPEKRAFIGDLVARLNKKMPNSKSRTQTYRDVLADPRTAAGFRGEWKEMVHPVVVERSKGSKLWDIDGNEYVDIVNGFGQTMFGHAPDFVVDAVAKQLKEGFAIGPQTPLAGEVARLFAEMTGNERVTFCNTGSEAVMAAMRIARAVTGREKIVVFSGAYHGQFDEVLAKAAASKTHPGAQPIAPGITQEAVSNLVILPYGSDESLGWVRAHADDLAAVVIETVQSRHPGMRPRDFLSELRAITEASETALVFDEVVTGFRAHPGGMQAVFGIRADLATYGKVVGGGMPVGVLAGKAKFMDALDGGFWRYGDDSVPETAPTFFAGTFVRHPLVLAACKATLAYMKEKGPALQQDLNDKMARLVADMNAHLAARGVKTRLESFASWCYATFTAEDPLASLLYHHMRLLGVHVIEGFPWFITTEHSEADLAKIADAFKQSIDALQSVGVLAPAAGAEIASDLPAEIPVAEEQREIWLAAELSEEASCAYNEGATVTLEGDLKPDVLTAALNDVVARHEALRMTFSREGDRLRIAPSLAVDIPFVDLTTESDPDARFVEILDEEARTPFDLTNGPLLRARLCRRAPNKHALVMTTHHIMCDGWSYGVVIDELAAFYGARLSGTKPDLGPVTSYRRYAADRNRSKPQDGAVEKYWLAEYQDLPPPLELPSDRPRPRVKTFRGATHTEYLDSALVASVKKAGARSGVTLFATLFAATQVVFGKLSGQDDIALTVPMAGQTQFENEVLVGHCVNFLPVRARMDVTAPFVKHLETVKAKTFQAIDHQSYTYGTLVQRLDLKRDPNRTPITDVQFNLEKFGRGVEFQGLKTTVITNPKAFVVFDLFLNMTEGADGVRVDVDYSTDLYDKATIARWLAHLRALLREIASDPTRPISKMSILTADERRWLLDDLNATQVDYPKDKMIHELIEAQTARTPGAVALRYQDHAFTYRELDDMATNIAARLVSLAPGGKRIAVALPRSVDLVATLLAVLKSGNAYVPLDPTHPPARLTQTLEAADISLLVCAEDRIAALAPPRAQVVRLDRPAPVAASAAIARPREGAAASAYVIFTSGSTGTPKGVEIEHRAVVNFLYSMAKAPGFTARDTIIALTTISFDIAGLELYLPLVNGGCAVVANRDEVKDGFALADMINRSGATVVQATPSLWRILIEAGVKLGPNLKMLCGGEPLPRDLAQLLTEGGGELWNVYGPTETTIWSSAGRVEPGAEIITIGAPIANTEIHILDAHGALVPPGVVGDVYIGGDGLARGYFNRPDLTAAAFRAIDIVDGVSRRLYRTGDVGRRLPNGAIQLQGRKDQQIKLRGYRIELEDIEANIRGLSGVSEAAVMVHGGEADARLVAFYVPASGRELDHQRLQRELSEKLPEYMVPSAWQRLDRMPQTANGKLDRKALPPLFSAQHRPAAKASAVANRSPLERTLAEIWMDVLKVGEVAADDRIFALGANSLHLFRIAAQLADRGIPLRTRHLMQNPTIGELAAMVQEAGATAVASAADGVPSLRDFRRGSRRKNPQ